MGASIDYNGQTSPSLCYCPRSSAGCFRKQRTWTSLDGAEQDELSSVLCGDDLDCNSRQTTEVFEPEHRETTSTGEAFGSLGSLPRIPEVRQPANDAPSHVVGPDTEDLSPRSLNGMDVAIFTYDGVKSFRRSIKQQMAPTELERKRGVYIERTYDFHSVKSETMRKKVGDEVHHRRAVLQRDAPEDDSGWSSSEDSTSSRSSSSESMSKPCEQMRRKVIKRQLTASNMEVVTHWGVLVGRVMHSHILNFRDVTKAAIGSRRLEKQSKCGTVLNSVAVRASRICEEVLRWSEQAANEAADTRDKDWEPEGILHRIFGEEYADTLVLLAKAVRKLLSAQPMLAQTETPCRVFGDVHGQLRDLLLLFHAFGHPGSPNAPNYVFNGDLVDRGSHQLEVLFIVISFKLAYPNRVWILRGNHEVRSMNQVYGFQKECVSRLGSALGQTIFDAAQGVFEQLPLACTVDQKVLVVHGGIGDGKWNLSDVKGIRRPLDEEEFEKDENKWIFDLLWSDPIEDSIIGVFGVHDSPRGGCASQFAWDVTTTFCARNGLSLIIRSHQSKHESLGFEVMHGQLLMRVFSARDYEGHGNDGAVLLLHKLREGEGEGLLGVSPTSVTVKYEVFGGDSEETQERSQAGGSWRRAAEEQERQEEKFGLE
eukprot:CAMPEP_0117471076 /NCGR_PEP_ID=MMETSP0784-20121206/7548_1 /TAXON_ID=39447 /ORGANISM="" /LENGTH=651 /DNA_ID=CAMNT_0005265191 /DNA_START=162 /DNA_END=2120 /DNA_ORIENTATION=-